MKIKELKKKEALCEAINMKFDEANELFEAETLQSMQMAQISGGTTAVPIPPAAGKAITEGIFLIASLMESFNTITEFCSAWKERLGGTPPPASATVEIKTDGKGNFGFTVRGAVTVDSIITPDIKIYGVDSKPTPIGNSNSGSTDMP